MVPMSLRVPEGSYPLTFRKEDAAILGEHLHHRHSVDLVGMKRVGISSFLRYFLANPQISTTFISKDEHHVFIPVDLNDLVEREIFPFWALTFKRLLDEVEQHELPEILKQTINANFLSAIQSHDLFLLLDGVRRSLTAMVDRGFLPTLFFLRFDRMKDAVTPEFFNNLQGLQDATQQKLAFVFTSFRTLDALSPQVFSKASLSGFSQVMFFKPSVVDLRTIYEAYNQRYQLSLTDALVEALLVMVGGNVQYLQMVMIILNEQKQKLSSAEELFALLAHDERIALQSEELWESLSPVEKRVVLQIHRQERVSEEEKKDATYIFSVGMVQSVGKTWELFSPLFAQYLGEEGKAVLRESDIAFTKKEHQLFSLLKERLGEICERDTIIEAVWPEYQEFGVSDWSIDRLVARVRAKLKQQTSPYEIKTIRTRGYVLISKV
jgi:hypothetical protein